MNGNRQAEEYEADQGEHKLRNEGNGQERSYNRRYIGRELKRKKCRMQNMYKNTKLYIRTIGSGKK